MLITHANTIDYSTQQTVSTKEILVSEILKPYLSPVDIVTAKLEATLEALAVAGPEFRKAYAHRRLTYRPIKDSSLSVVFK